MPPGALQLACQGRTEHGEGARFGMRHAKVEGGSAMFCMSCAKPNRGGAMFCMSGFKNVVFLMVYETQTSIILYVICKTQLLGCHVLHVMCKTQPPGVHQAAHDGPDGITPAGPDRAASRAHEDPRRASNGTFDHQNMQNTLTFKAN